MSVLLTAPSRPEYGEKDQRVRDVVEIEKCYRKILSVSWREHRTNESVANELGVELGSLIDCVKSQKLPYFGHIKRHQCLDRDIMKGMIEGSRSRGKTRRRWEDDVKDWLSMDVVSAGRLAADRNGWRTAIRDATSDLG